MPLPEVPLPLPQSICIPTRKPPEPTLIDHTAEAATLPAPPVPGEPLPLPQSFYAPQRKIGGGVPLHSGVAASEAVPPLPAVPLPQQPLPTPESARLAQSSADDVTEADDTVPPAPPITAHATPAGTVNSHTEV